MEPVDLLVVGGSGFVGAKLVATALQAGRSTAYTYAHHPLQLAAAAYRVCMPDERALAACIAEVRPRGIVYCAVPNPGSDRPEHEAVSVEGIRQVLAALADWECRLVYVSTNAVFSGKAGPYREDALPDPEGMRDYYRTYALTRAMGEQIALAGWEDVIVARTADVNGWDVNGQLNPRLVSIVEQLKAGTTIMRLSQAFITPTLVDNLADCLLEISSPDFHYRGVLHLAGGEQISYYDFARMIARGVQADEGLIQADTSRSWNIGLESLHTQRILSTRLLGVKAQIDRIFT
jgi:dTDP-4-dehydrorhamnose reductase